jgi:hypothetical protein
MRFHPRPCHWLNRRTGALILGVLLGTVLSGIDGSQAATSAGTLEAETMTLPSRGSVVADATASGGKAMKMYANGTATGSVVLSGPAATIAVVAEGNQCDGAPRMVVKIDAVQVGTTVSVGAATWTAYEFTKAVTAGTHSVSIAFVNDSSTTSCDRNLVVDKVTFAADAGTSGNLALNRPATASSVDSTGRGPQQAVDGSVTTRWSSAYSDAQWISIDLGSVQTVSRVKLNWETAYGKAYEIQLSTDAANWTTRYSTATGDGGVDDLTLSGSGRYVRMFGTARATQWGYSLWEFEVYSAPAGEAMPVGDVTSGGHTWRQIVTEDFSKDAPLGSWNDAGTLTSCPADREAVYYTGATGTAWTA